MLTRLLRSHLRPYASLLWYVVGLQIVATMATLTLPNLNADIIDNGVVTGDTAYIWRVGAVMLVVTAVQVFFAVGATYFGSKAAMAFGQLPEVAVAHQFQRKEFTAGSGAAGDLDLEGVGEAQAAARFGRLAGPHLGHRMAGVDDALQHDLHLAATGFFAMQPGLDDLGVVEYQEVAGGDQGKDIGEAQIVQRITAHVQEPAAAALCRRMLGDQLGGQGKIEVLDGQGHGRHRGHEGKSQRERAGKSRAL